MLTKYWTKGIKTKDREYSLIDKFWFWYYDSWIYRTLYQYSWLYRLRWHVTHWWRKDHWVKTNLDIGYHDKVGLMEDALFSLVENYVARDKEDAFSNVVVEGEERGKIIKILHFYRIGKPELEKICDRLLDDLYGRYHFEFTPCEDNPELSKMHVVYDGDEGDSGWYTEEEREKMRNELRELEQYIFDLTQMYLKMAIDVRGYLWT